MWFVIVHYREGPEVVKQIFTSQGEAERHIKKVGKIDGPVYAIAHSYGWHGLTSNPHWNFTEVKNLAGRHEPPVRPSECFK